MEYEYDLPSKEARKWAMVCHLAALAGLSAIPFANIIGPFVIWLIKRDVDPFVDEQGKEAINFQITMTIYMAVSLLLILVLIGIVFVFIIPVVSVALTIVAAIKANDGEHYRYPYTLRLID